MALTQNTSSRGCARSASDGLSEVCAEGNLSLEDVYATPEGIADVSLRLKEWRGQGFCTLPFCHTVEAEALGAHIVSGNAPVGSRAGAPVFASLEEVLHVRMPTEPQGRMARMLAACALLADRGERVAFTLSGPVSILSCLVDIGTFFRAWRKDRDLACAALSHLGEQLTPFAHHMAEAGTAAISYADPPCAPAIVGPRCSREIAEEFTFGFVETLCREIPDEVDILLCPLALPPGGEGERAGRARVRCLAATARVSL